MGEACFMDDIGQGLEADHHYYESEEDALYGSFKEFQLVAESRLFCPFCGRGIPAGRKYKECEWVDARGWKRKLIQCMGCTPNMMCHDNILAYHVHGVRLIKKCDNAEVVK